MFAAMLPRKGALVMTAALGAVACQSGVSQGSFEVHFSWQDEPPEQALWVIARIVRDQGGSIVAEAEPAQYDDGVELRFPEVPNGSGYVVVVQMKDNARRDGRTLYFGRSAPFELAAGKHTVVEVVLALQPAPSATGDGPVSIVEAIDDPARARSLVAGPVVTLALRPQDATRAVVANDVTLLSGRQERELSELERGDEGAYLWPEWDLNDGYCSDGECVDGLRQVYVSFINADGFTSEVFRVGVDLDTQAPFVLIESVAPNPASAATIVSVRVEPSEPLSAAPKLQVMPQDPGFGAGQLAGQSYVFEYVSDGGASEDIEYSFAIDMVDLVGNAGHAELQAEPLRFQSQLAVVGAALERRPSYADAIDGSTGLSRLSLRDPTTGERVTAVLTLTGSEPIGTAVEPRATATHASGASFELAYDAARSAGATAVFSHTFEDGTAPGEYSLSVDWRDAGGYRGDGQVPIALALSDLDSDGPWGQVDMSQTLLVRRPWGLDPSGDSDGYGGAVRYSIAGAVMQHADAEPADCVVAVHVYAAARASAGQLIGRAAVLDQEDAGTEACPQDSFDMPELAGGNLIDVYVAPVTASGQLGALARVTEGEWVATLAGKEVGNVLDNPHALRTRGRRLPWLRDEGGVETDGSALALRDEVGVTTRARAQWSLYDGDASYMHTGLRLAYDAGRGRVVAFGGDSDADYSNLTWEWDGRRWYQASSACAPGPGCPAGRVWHALAYHAGRDRTMLFGGAERTADGNLEETADLWEWDGHDWSLVTPQGDAPPVLILSAMAYDPARGKLVLFGGAERTGQGDVLHSLTWEWDGRSWRVYGADCSPGEDCPPGRLAHTMVYDQGRGGVLVFGGESVAQGMRDDLWLWDGDRWRKVDASNPPPARSNHAMAYDAARGVVLVTGGYGNAYLRDMWELDGDAWRQLTPDPMPPARAYHAMVYDPVQREVLIVGGRAEYPPEREDPTEVWAWDGAKWSTRVQPEPPAARQPIGMAYDSARDRSVLLIDPVAVETWEWSDGRWSVAGALPSPRYEMPVVYDASREHVVIFGGMSLGPTTDALDEMLEWNGSAWVDVGPMSVPPARMRHSMAYHEIGGSGRLLLFGGDDDIYATPQLSDTWQWNGQRWDQLAVGCTPTVDCPRAGADQRMVYDPSRGRVVVTGHNFSVPNTWEWDGTGWSQHAEGCEEGLECPFGRSRHGMVYDPTRERVVIFGGLSSIVFNDIWEWDGSHWTQVESDGFIPVSHSHGMAYDEARRHILVFGGSDDLFLGDDAWRNETRSLNLQTRPSHRLRIALGALAPAARLAPHADDPVVIDEVRFSGRVGGDSTAAGSASPGAMLSGWHGLGWEPLACNDSVTDAPGELAWSTRDPALIRRLQSGDALHFDVSPLADNGSGPLSTVRSDYVEVRVRYHLGAGAGVISAAAGGATDSPCP